MAPQITPALQEDQQRVEHLLSTGDMGGLRTFLQSQHPADIADLLEMLDEAKRIQIFDLLQTDVAAEVLDETRTEVTREIVDSMPDEQVADLLEAMPMDDAAEILSELRERRADDILELMQPVEAAEVEALLAYPEDTAGRLMTTDIARLDASWTVEQALSYLRSVDPEVETLSYLYITNGANQLVGVVPTWRMLTTPLDRFIKEIMDPDVTPVTADTDQEDVARIVSQYDFFAIPVVSETGELLGIITHDDVIDILEEEFTEDVQRFGGSVPLEHSYFSTPILGIARKRIGWLLVLFLTEMLTGTVMRLFESELEQVVALSFFIPLLIGTGGNAGSQATSTIVRALAVGEARFEDLAKLLWHELWVGVSLGIVMGIVGYLRALTWGTSVQLAATVSGSLLLIVIWANVIGALLPPLAAKLKIDPAVISGPVMSTLVDATGLLLYFSLARWIMGL